MDSTKNNAKESVLDGQALWHLASKKSIWKSATVSASEELVQIKSLFSLISNGTEKTVCMSKVPETAFAEMEVPYMDGNFNLPIKYGYSLVGEIIEENHPYKNKLVHLMHPHQDFCAVANDDLSLIPNSMPAARATLASNMETAVNAWWDSGVSVGDRVLIVGGGLLGILLGKLLRDIPGIFLAFAELNPERVEYLKQLDFEISDQTEIKYDLAFHTSGTQIGLQAAIQSVGLEGKIVELSWYGDHKFEIQLGTSFHYERKQIISSQVGKIPSHKLNRWTYKRRKETVFEILKDPWFDQLLHPISKETAIKHFDDLRNNRQVPVAPVIRY